MKETKHKYYHCIVSSNNVMTAVNNTLKQALIANASAQAVNYEALTLYTLTSASILHTIFYTFPRFLQRICKPSRALYFLIISFILVT